MDRRECHNAYAVLHNFPRWPLARGGYCGYIAAVDEKALSHFQLNVI